MSKNLLELPKSKILLLTATPVQNSISELFSLIRIANPDILPARMTAEDFVLDAEGRVLKDSMRGELAEITSRVICRTTRSQSGIVFPKRSVVN